MTTESTTEVLICGAGAAGLTLAIDLARRGIACRLIEKLDTPFQGSRGKGIQPRTQEVFEDLGVLNRILALGGPYPRQREYHDHGDYIDSKVVDAAAPTQAEPYPLPVMLPQFLTEQVLRERLAELGKRPEFGTELVSFEPQADGVVAQLQTRHGRETVHAGWLVGADGGRSFVRHALGIGFPGQTLGERALVADVSLTGLTREVWHRFGRGDPQRQISICPLAGTSMFQLQGPVPPEGEIDLTPAGLTHLLRQRSHHAGITVHEVSWASVFQMSSRLADRYRDGRVLLAGDAAHIHPPTGGQGLNTSIQDAYNLGWKLAAVIRGAPAPLLDTYQQERRPVAQQMLGLASHLLDAMKRGEMRRGREVRQLDIGYPATPLALEQPARQAYPQAGDRAPDARLQGASGQPIRLFDLMRGPHWTLILFQGDREQIPPRAGLHIHAIGPGQELIDHADEFAATYTPRMGDALLVRPDGYIGAMVGGNAMPALEAYLATVGLTP